jgi:hypothetical protein
MSTQWACTGRLAAEPESGTGSKLNGRGTVLFEDLTRCFRTFKTSQ